MKSINANLRIGGFYEDEHQLIVSEELADLFRAERETRFPSFLSIENDLLIMDSIGQHFCLLESPEVVRLNPNLMRFGVSSKLGLESYADLFRSKYPFSTVFFLRTLLTGGPFTDNEIVGLLYPDSAILKQFAHTYRNNVIEWLRWMGLESTTERFFLLQGKAQVKQIARCLFREQGTSQFSLVFKGSENSVSIANMQTADKVLEFFCQLLSLEKPQLSEGRYIMRAWNYSRFNAVRQSKLSSRKKIFVTQLQHNYVSGGQLRSKEPGKQETSVRVLSEALVTHGEWSVTTNQTWWPVSNEGIQISRQVVMGRNTELEVHVQLLGLNEPCIHTDLGCFFAGKNCPPI